MNKQSIVMTAAAIGVMLVAHSALAQEEPEPRSYDNVSSYAWGDPRLPTGIGVGVQLGAGVSGFTDDGVRDTVDSDVSGLWAVRATFGTHMPLALDVGYVGTAVDVTPFTIDDTGILLGTAVEGALRWNILPHYKVTPYAFVGVGWQHYDVTGAHLSRATAGIADSDDLLMVPMGLGVSYRDTNGVVADFRGTFRAAQSSDLIVASNGGNAGLDTWEASISLGYEL